MPGGLLEPEIIAWSADVEQIARFNLPMQDRGSAIAFFDEQNRNLIALQVPRV